MNIAWRSPEGFEALVQEHQGTVFRTLTRLTGPGVHVQDLAQEVFLRLYRALPEFRGDAALSTYLYRIVLNVAQDEWKSRRRYREHFSAAPAFTEDSDTGSWIEDQTVLDGGQHNRSPEQLLMTAEIQEAVEAALLDLPEAERAALVLYYGEDCSYMAVAAALAIPINTVRTHLHRGRKRLAALIQERFATKQRPTTTEGRPKR